MTEKPLLQTKTNSFITCQCSVSKPLLSSGTRVYHNLVDHHLFKRDCDAWQLNLPSSPQMVQVFQMKIELLGAIWISDISQTFFTNIIMRF